MRIAAEARKPVLNSYSGCLGRHNWIASQALGTTGLPCVMHCFTGSPEQAHEALDLGFYLSFSGVVTYPKAVNVQQSAKEAPLNRILVETDCPYLAPVPYRGKRNEPSYVVYTAQKLAELRDESLETIARETSANFERVFLNRLH